MQPVFFAKYAGCTELPAGFHVDTVRSRWSLKHTSPCVQTQFRLGQFGSEEVARQMVH